MARGADIEVIVWIVAVALWGIAKLIGRAVEKAKPSENKPHKSAAESVGDLISMFQQTPALRQSPGGLIPAQQTESRARRESLPPPAPRRTSRPPKVSVFDEGCDEVEYPRQSVSNLVFASGNSLRLPAMHFPTAGLLDRRNPNSLRPDWKSGHQVRQAMLASIILDRPAGDSRAPHTPLG